MNEHDEDYAFEIARQRRIDKGEPDGDPAHLLKGDVSE